MLTRDDYLGFATNRNALASIVKATLMTRHLLFVGFGLRDDHFHEIVHDVRRAVPRGSGVGATALTLWRDPLDAELWSESLDLVPMAEPGESVDAAARQLELLLDMLAARAADAHEYLLSDAFASVRSQAEQRLVDRLVELQSADEEERALLAWTRVQALLAELGAEPLPPDELQG